MVLHQISTALVVYGVFKVPRIRRRPCAYILGMFFLLVRQKNSSSPFYGLNIPPAGHNHYLPYYNNPIQRDLTHSHWSGDAHIEGGKSDVLLATECDRAMRRGVPARLAHAPAVWCRAVGRPPK